MCFIYCTLLFFPFLRWMWDLPKQNTMNNWTTTLTGDGLNCSHKNGDGMGIVYYRFHRFTTLFQLFINYPTIICSSSTNIHYLLNIHLFIVVLSHWNLHLEWIFPLKSGDFGDDPPCIIPKIAKGLNPREEISCRRCALPSQSPPEARLGAMESWENERNSCENIGWLEQKTQLMHIFVT